MDHSVTPIAVLVAMLGVAVYWDLRFRKVPNQLALGIAAAGVLAQLQRGGPRAAGLALLAGLAAFALLFLGWMRGRIGGGDVKLAAAAGIWVGPSGLLQFLLAAAVCGGVVSAVCYGRSAARVRSEIRANLVGAVLGGGLPAAVPAAVPAPASAARERVSVPYAAAIAVGVGVALAFGELNP